MLLYYFWLKITAVEIFPIIYLITHVKHFFLYINLSTQKQVFFFFLIGKKYVYSKKAQSKTREKQKTEKETNYKEKEN